MAYAILRTQKIKTIDKLKAVEGHHFRTHSVKNADHTKSADNINFVDCGGELVNAVKNRIGSRKIRKNAVIAIEVLMTASPDFFRDNPEDYGVYDADQTAKFNQAAMQFLKVEFGEANIVSAVCHLDESTPHIQAVIIPIDPKSDRLNASLWLDGKKKLSAMQDRYFDTVKHLGLERGIRGSEAKHTTIQQFYGSLEAAEILSLPTPAVITPPPLLMTEKARESWAQDETQRLLNLQAPTIQPIAAKASQAALAKKKQKQAEATAKKYAAELEAMKKEAAWVRDIDLRLIAEKLGGQRDRYDKKQWSINGEKISIEDQKFFNFNQNQGGGGAIDLVMHIENLDFKQAVSWLGGNIDKHLAIGAAMSHARHTAQNAVKQPIPLPEPDEKNWPTVKTYLIEQRGLNPTVVDWLHKKQMVFADARENACFRYGTKGVERSGTRPGVKWKNFAGTKKQGFLLRSKKNAPGVVIVESALDAIAFAQLKAIDLRLKDYRDFDVIAVGGTGNQLVSSLVSQYQRIAIGFDNDLNGQGDKGYQAIKALLPSVERIKPEPPYKDWNDYLRPKEHHHEVNMEHGLDLGNLT